MQHVIGMGDTGLERPALTASKAGFSEKRTSPDTESDTPKDENDPDLAWLCRNWPGLADSIREQIIETAHAALSGGKTP